MNKTEEKKVEANELNEDNLNEVSGGAGGRDYLSELKIKLKDYKIKGPKLPGPDGILWKKFRDQTGSIDEKK